MPENACIHMRRKDRAQDDNWIKSFLQTAEFGTLVTIQDSQPHQNINTFVYDEESHALYIHTARQGMTRSKIETSEQVSFSVAKMGRMLPAKEAKEMSVEFASVVIFGRGSIVTDSKLARAQMQALLDKYFTEFKSGKDYRPITPTEMSEISVYRIDIEHWSGKLKKGDEDHPEAFIYPVRPI